MEDWTKNEVEEIVRNYFTMFSLELSQKKYNKSYYRRALRPLLNERTEGAIEFKHQNISACLVKMGLPYIKGYVPLFNYQKDVVDREVSDFLTKNRLQLESQFDKFSRESVNVRSAIDFEAVLKTPPEFSSDDDDVEINFNPIKINYLKREQNNRLLGEQGENFVIKYEEWRLKKEGSIGFISKIKWASKELGDGLGYDIHSFNSDGSDRFIEVKTTKLAKETPIYISNKEVHFSRKNSQSFHLYRVFDFISKPRLFVRQGCYDNYCRLIPQSFKGFF